MTGILFGRDVVVVVVVVGVVALVLTVGLGFVVSFVVLGLELWWTVDRRLVYL